MHSNHAYVYEWTIAQVNFYRTPHNHPQLKDAKSYCEYRKQTNLIEISTPTTSTPIVLQILYNQSIPTCIHQNLPLLNTSLSKKELVLENNCKN